MNIATPALPRIPRIMLPDAKFLRPDLQAVVATAEAANKAAEVAWLGHEEVRGALPKLIASIQAGNIPPPEKLITEANRVRAGLIRALSRYLAALDTVKVAGGALKTAIDAEHRRAVGLREQERLQVQERFHTDFGMHDTAARVASFAEAGIKNWDARIRDMEAASVPVMNGNMNQALDLAWMEARQQLIGLV